MLTQYGPLTVPRSERTEKMPSYRLIDFGRGEYKPLQKQSDQFKYATRYERKKVMRETYFDQWYDYEMGSDWEERRIDGPTPEPEEVPLPDSNDGYDCTKVQTAPEDVALPTSADGLDATDPISEGKVEQREK